jgi:hypothetical protein
MILGTSFLGVCMAIGITTKSSQEYATATPLFLNVKVHVLLIT